MLRGQEGFIWKGTYDLHFKHHETVGTLRSSAQLKCNICRILLDTFPKNLEPPLDFQDEKQLPVTSQDTSREESKPLSKFRADKQLSIMARLSVQQGKNYNLGKSQAESENRESIPKYDTGMLYRLDFRLELDSFKGRRTFVLKEIGQLFKNPCIVAVLMDPPRYR